MFEGEFINDKCWEGKGYDLMNNIAYELKEGKGIFKEYNNNGKLLLECEYLNGQKNGKGKEYNKDGRLKFEGEYINGQKMEKEKNIIKIIT